MKKMTKFYIGLFLLALLTPIGLLASGTAWGEWEKEFFIKVFGYIPEGMDRISDIWHAPFPDYTITGTGEHISYILSALAGILLVLVITWGIGKLLARKENTNIENK